MMTSVIIAATIITDLASVLGNSMRAHEKITAFRKTAMIPKLMCVVLIILSPCLRGDTV